MQAGRLDDAAGICRALLDVDASDPWANHLLGLAADQQGDFGAALTWLRRSLASSPSNSEFHGNLAVASQRSRDPLTTIEAATRALSLDGGNAAARVVRHQVMKRLVEEGVDEGARATPPRELMRAYLADLLDNLHHIPSKAYHDLLRQQLSEVVAAPGSVTTIEINDSCNIDCVMCKTSEAKRPKGLMKIGTFESVIQRLTEEGPVTVLLHTIGDPLANKRLPEYLAILRRYGGKVGSLSSNCLMMDRHIDTLFEFRDVIQMIRPSIDAASKEVYEVIRFGGRWEQLVANLRLFAERNARAEKPFPINVSNIISKDNFHQIGLIPEVFSFLTAFENFGFAFINSLAPKNDYFLAASYFDDAYVQNSPCSQLWGPPNILKDGSLTTCCRDYDGDLVFANLLTDRIDTAYNNDTIRATRRAHIANDVASMPALCRKCYRIDARLDAAVNGIIRYYALFVGKSGGELQGHLNLIGPKLKQRDYRGVLGVIDSM